MSSDYIQVIKLILVSSFLLKIVEWHFIFFPRELSGWIKQQSYARSSALMAQNTTSFLELRLIWLKSMKNFCRIQTSLSRRWSLEIISSFCSSGMNNRLIKAGIIITTMQYHHPFFLAWHQWIHGHHPHQTWGTPKGDLETVDRRKVPRTFALTNFRNSAQRKLAGRIWDSEAWRRRCRHCYGWSFTTVNSKCSLTGLFNITLRDILATITDCCLWWCNIAVACLEGMSNNWKHFYVHVINVFL